MNKIDMNLKTAGVSLIFVTVQFSDYYSSQKEYTYKTNLEVTVGDAAIVDSPQGLVVVKIVSISEDTPETNYPIKWLADTVDREYYTDILDVEKSVQDIVDAGDLLYEDHATGQSQLKQRLRDHYTEEMCKQAAVIENLNSEIIEANKKLEAYEPKAEQVTLNHRLDFSRNDSSEVVERLADDNSAP